MAREHKRYMFKIRTKGGGVIEAKDTPSRDAPVIPTSGPAIYGPGLNSPDDR